MSVYAELIMFLALGKQKAKEIQQSPKETTEGEENVVTSRSTEEQ